jgi:hypothetical protein
MRTIDASSKRPRPLERSGTKDGIVAVAEFVEKSGAFMKTANPDVKQNSRASMSTTSMMRR